MNQTVKKALMQLRYGEPLAVWKAAKILIKEDDHSIEQMILEIMAVSSEPERRIAAAWVLGFLGSSAALDALIQILGNQSENSPLREQAAESLGYLSHPKARPVLVANLTDENADVVFSCAFALRTVGRTKDIPHLAKLAQSSSLTNSYGASVAQEAREAIEQILHRAQHGDDS